MALGAIAGIIAAIAATEGAVALLKQLMGDPEAEVENALQQLASRNQRRALALEAVEQRGQEDVEERLAAFNRFPGQVLSKVSLARSEGPEISPQDTALLEWVSQRLGVSPAYLSKVSSPLRDGDLSQTFRSLGKSLDTSAAPPPGGAPPTGGPPQMGPAGP